VVLNVDGKRERQGWVVWEEKGRYPDVIIELMSPSTAAMDTGVKKDIHQLEGLGEIVLEVESLEEFINQSS